MINESNIASILEHINEIKNQGVNVDRIREDIERLVYDLRAMQLEIERLGGVIENLQAKSLENKEEL